MPALRAWRKIASGMGPTRSFERLAVLVNGIEAGVRICMRDAAGVGQVRLRELAFSVGRIGKSYSWRRAVAAATVVARLNGTFIEGRLR